MAGTHRRGTGSALRKKAAHRAKSERQPYGWLGAGAVVVGMGMAMANGTAIALAEDTDSGSTSSPGDSSSTSSRPNPGKRTPGDHSEGTANSDDKADNSTESAADKDESADGEYADGQDSADGDEQDDSEIGAENEGEALSVEQGGAADDGGDPADIDRDSHRNDTATDGDSESAAITREGVISAAPLANAGAPTVEPATITATPELGNPARITARVVDIEPTAISTHAAAVPALGATSSESAEVVAPAPITLKSIVTDVLTWIGLGPLVSCVIN